MRRTLAKNHQSPIVEWFFKDGAELDTEKCLSRLHVYTATFDSLQMLLDPSKRLHSIKSTAGIDDGITEDFWREVGKVDAKIQKLDRHLWRELASRPLSCSAV